MVKVKEESRLTKSKWDKGQVFDLGFTIIQIKGPEHMSQ